MSEQNTSNPKTIASGSKVKDPRKVAAGKRLAAISKQAKEAKRLKQNAEMNSAYAQEETGNNKTLYFVGGLLVVVGAASYLLFTNKEKVVRTLITNKEKVVRTLTGDKEESDPVPKQKPTPKKEKFKSVFDD